MKISLLIISFVVVLLVWVGIFNNIYQSNSAHLPSKSSAMNPNYKLATFAWWCFWCMQPAFDETPWVIQTYVGYAWWDQRTATYDKVSMGHTKHREWIQITYDPSKVDYKTLLEVFRKQIDPTNPNGQFYDTGFQYTTAIYTHDSEQELRAQESKKLLEWSGRYSKPIATVIEPYTTFFPSEEYHQKYYLKAAARYASYKTWSGRQARVHDQEDLKIFDNQIIQTQEPVDHSIFQKPSSQELKKTLSSLQYKVTQEEGTEMPFENEYWDEHRDGLYVDIVSWEPLFTSFDKYDSGTGRPSFTKPINPEAIRTKDDYKLWVKRTEVRSTYADSHLGHVFDDGPVESWGLRYCMNSASMAFVPVEDLEKRGYGIYKVLFAKQ